MNSFEIANENIYQINRNFKTLRIMYANDLTLRDIFHPSEIIKDEMEAQGIKQADLVLIFTHPRRMFFIKVIDVFFYPMNIRFFCSVAVMT